MVNAETSFATDLGWEEGFQEYESETLKTVINPPENFETVRYVHGKYTGKEGLTQYDLWLEFYFANDVGNHTGGLNYERIGLDPEDNYKLTRTKNGSFFRLEFYKAPSGETINSVNRKLVFTKNLPLTSGQEVYYTPISHNIYVPVFLGTNYKNRENMYFYWFQDGSVLEGSTYSGNDFYLAVKFYNAIDGTSIPFANKIVTISGSTINEDVDMYRKVVLDQTNYSYVIYTGITEDHRAGTSSVGTPLRWYATQVSNQIGGYNSRSVWQITSTSDVDAELVCSDVEISGDYLYLEGAYDTPIVGAQFYVDPTGSVRSSLTSDGEYLRIESSLNGDTYAVVFSSGKVVNVVQC